MIAAEVAPGLVCDAAGALHVLEDDALLVADPHLGYAAARASNAVPGDLDHVVRDRVLHALARTGARRLVVAGDVIDARIPSAAARGRVRAVLDAWEGAAEVVLVRGNHDHALDEIAENSVECWRGKRVLVVHGDEAAKTADLRDRVLVVGHEHPALALRAASGRSLRVPAILTRVEGIGDGRRRARAVVLPAQSPWASGVDPRRRRRFQGAALAAEDVWAFEAHACTGEDVLAFGPLKGLAARLRAARGAAPPRPR